MIKLLEVHPLPRHRLSLRYSDGVAGEVDLSYLLGKGVFRSWQKSGEFDRVFLTDLGAPAWPEDLELCPHSLYLRLTGKNPEDLFPSLTALEMHA